MTQALYAHMNKKKLKKRKTKQTKKGEYGGCVLYSYMEIEE
jgi:hypothetical protein